MEKIRKRNNDTDTLELPEDSSDKFGFITMECGEEEVFRFLKSGVPQPVPSRAPSSSGEASRTSRHRRDQRSGPAGAGTGRSLTFFLSRAQSSGCSEERGDEVADAASHDRAPMPNPPACRPTRRTSATLHRMELDDDVIEEG